MMELILKECIYYKTC